MGSLDSVVKQIPEMNFLIPGFTETVENDRF